MTDQPIVSVVIPTRNRCRLLQETVASVFQQTWADWELIIVDDASEDETGSWLEGLEDPRVRRLRLTQCSERAAARNLGLEAAQGQLILFLDDDDLLPERALETHLETLKRNPTVVASVGSHVAFDPGGSQRTIRIVPRRVVRRIFEDVLFTSRPPVSGQCLFRTSAIRSVKGWDGTYIPIEDHVLWLQLGRSAPVALLPDVVLLYRVHPGQWRPANLEQMITEVRERAVNQMQGRERERAERVLRARTLAQTALEHYGRADALMFYLKALGLAPGLLWSPLTRPLIVEPMIRGLVGKTGRRLGRFFFSWMKSSS
jgi:glycosyltransferase involved in cell wall biosynthesis